MSNKVRKKIKRTVNHSYSDGVGELIKKQDALREAVDRSMKEMVEKHNNMAAMVQGVESMMKTVLTTASSEIGKVSSRLELFIREFGSSAAGLDRNVLALAEMVKESFGQVIQIDHMLNRLSEGTKISIEFEEKEIDEMREEAIKWYQDVTTDAFGKVQERFSQMDKERRDREAAEQVAKEAAEKAALDMEEKDRIEAEGKQAATADIAVIGTMGGRGADYPEGAEFFGGK